MIENWKTIDGYEGLYQVSNLGNVKSLNYNRTKKEKILKPGKSSEGYLFVSLYKNRKVKNFYIHRLVANVFLNNPQNFPQVNHKDENPSNNCVDNLEWCDSKYNNNYGSHNERLAERNTNNPKISKQIIQYTLEGQFVREWPSTNEIQRHLGYDKGNISNCCNGKRKTAYRYIWKYILDNKNGKDVENE